jgi:tetratricopeptide (TPR) repeat protein
MKKFTIVSLLLLAVVFIARAQSKKPKPTDTKPQTTATTEQKQEAEPAQAQMSPLAAHFARKYSIATRWNDSEVSKDALYDLITEFPGSDSLIFVLAYSYYENQKYPSSILVCQDLLARNPKDLKVLELSAAGYEALNIMDRALQNYESMFLLTSNSTALYKMAFLQFQLKRFKESITNADILLSKPDAETLKVVFTDATGKEKEYKMKVAVLNLKGMIYKEQADKVNAKKFFDEALAMAPDFTPAKENLAALK